METKVTESVVNSQDLERLAREVRQKEIAASAKPKRPYVKSGLYGKKAGRAIDLSDDPTVPRTGPEILVVSKAAFDRLTSGPKRMGKAPCPAVQAIINLMVDRACVIRKDQWPLKSKVRHIVYQQASRLKRKFEVVDTENGWAILRKE